MTGLVEETKPPISSGNPKSGHSDTDVFREYKRFWVERLVTGTPNQEGKLARDWVETKRVILLSCFLHSPACAGRNRIMLRNSPGRSGRNGEKRKLHNEIKNLNTEITQLSIAKESTNEVQPIDNKQHFKSHLPT